MSWLVFALVVGGSFIAYAQRWLAWQRISRLEALRRLGIA